MGKAFAGFEFSLLCLWPLIVFNEDLFYLAPDLFYLAHSASEE